MCVCCALASCCLSQQHPIPPSQTHLHLYCPQPHSHSDQGALRFYQACGWRWVSCAAAPQGGGACAVWINMLHCPPAVGVSTHQCAKTWSFQHRKEIHRAAIVLARDRVPLAAVIQRQLRRARCSQTGSLHISLEKMGDMPEPGAEQRAKRDGGWYPPRACQPLAPVTASSSIICVRSRASTFAMSRSPPDRSGTCVALPFDLQFWILQPPFPPARGTPKRRREHNLVRCHGSAPPSVF